MYVARNKDMNKMLWYRNTERNTSYMDNMKSGRTVMQVTHEGSAATNPVCYTVKPL